MDGFDLLILGFMLSAISADLHLTPGQAGSLVTWTLIGAVFGGIVFGALSDRYGRIRVLTWTIMLFAIFTGLCAFATGYWDLLIYRTIAGIGLGGEFGIGMALAAEAWPAKHRARVSSYVALGWQVGVLAAALLTPLLLPVIGWRGMFLVGVIPALVAWIIRNKIHEPEVFVRKPKERKASRFEAFKLLVKDKATTKVSIGVIVLTSVQNFGYYGIMIWMPSFLSKQLGFSLTKSSMWTAVTIVGMMAGIWIFGQLADRIGRKPSFLIFQLGAVIMVLTYSQLSDPTAMLWAWCGSGHVRQRHDGRLRRGDERGLPHGSTRHCTELAVQHWSRRGWPGPGRRRCRGHGLWFPDGDCTAGSHLCAGHDCHGPVHSRTQGQGTAVSLQALVTNKKWAATAAAHFFEE